VILRGNRWMTCGHGTPHSDSAVQREAEALIRDKVATVVGTDLSPATVTFDTGARVKVDGVAADESVLVEIFARQGKLKGGQHTRAKAREG
jgi:hypothetical protein